MTSGMVSVACLAATVAGVPPHDDVDLQASQLGGEVREPLRITIG